MGSPVSPSDVIKIITTAMEMYEKIKDQPEVMVKISKRMPRLKDYLEELNELINTKKHPGSLASLRPTQTKRLSQLMTDVKADMQEVLTLLQRWEKNEAFGGLKWRFDWVAHAVYALGSSPDKLDALYESIELHLNDINRFVILLSAFAQNQVLKAGNAKTTNSGKDKNKTPNQTSAAQPKKKPSPSPEPPIAKRRTDYKICFLDGYNKGRSRVAEAYLRLVREWTTRSDGEWRILNIHSSGLSVKRANGCDKEVIVLGEKMVDPAKNTSNCAMDSLFDNKLFNYSYKQTVRKVVQGRTSIGVARDLFSTYDFVVAFTLAQQVKLFKLRDALVKADKTAWKHGKGKIVLLGEYHKAGLQMYEPEPDTDREKWNKTTSTIKIACKAFLKKEFDWKQPAPGK